MAFATRSDLTVYQPDIGDMGLSTSEQDAFVTQAIADVQRDIRNRCGLFIIAINQGTEAMLEVLR